jgi:hypothetical protein
MQMCTLCCEIFRENIVLLSAYFYVPAVLCLFVQGLVIGAARPGGLFVLRVIDMSKARGVEPFGV